MHTSNPRWLLRVTFYWKNPLLYVVSFLFCQLVFPLMSPFDVKLHLLSTKSPLFVWSTLINCIIRETELGPKLQKKPPNYCSFLTVFPVVTLVMLLRGHDTLTPYSKTKHYFLISITHLCCTNLMKILKVGGREYAFLKSGFITSK